MEDKDRVETEELQKEAPEAQETGAETQEAPAGAEETAAEQPEAAQETPDTDQPAEEAAQAETAQAETGEDKEPEQAADGKESGGFFSRLRKEDKEKAALKEKVAELEDRALRQLAEFENFRRRTEKEKEQRFSMGEKNVIEKILPVVDNFERGLASMPEEERGNAFASGMEMIYKQLMKQLEDLGVKPIEAVGQPFDPNFHNAVMQVESEEYPSGTVAQEFQKGYLYHDIVVRYSMVGVVA